MDNNRHRFEQTANADEVLFFATAHFLFFNFIATAQNTLSFFFTPQTQRSKKMKECFLQRSIFES
jgi:hypothetical protein